MTRDEIIDALRLCQRSACLDCPYGSTGHGGCLSALLGDAAEMLGKTVDGEELDNRLAVLERRFGIISRKKADGIAIARKALKRRMEHEHCGSVRERPDRCASGARAVGSADGGEP